VKETLKYNLQKCIKECNLERWQRNKYKNRR